MKYEGIISDTKFMSIGENVVRLFLETGTVMCIFAKFIVYVCVFIHGTVLSFRI